MLYAVARENGEGIPRKKGYPHRPWYAEGRRDIASLPVHFPQIIMTIQHTRYVLALPDLEASASFYRDVLGFTIQETSDSGWRFFVKDDCCIMAGHCPDAHPPNTLGDHSYFGYFVVDDIDSYYAAVVSRGADVTKSLRDEPWGMREFGLRTIAGHRIMFGQDAET